MDQSRHTALVGLATQIREDVIRMLVAAGSGHSAGPLGMADIFAFLYTQVLRYDPLHPKMSDRDRLVLSNGHICPVLYATLAAVGFFSREELLGLRQFGSRLQGHPSSLDLPGVEVSSGPLGQGISQAIGMALALRAENSPAHVYCVMSDGEHDEGQTWEAVLFAAKERFANITIIVDRNDIQIDGFTHDVMPLEPFREKYETFGWYVMDIDGHDFLELDEVFRARKQIIDQPVVIIAETTPGKGVGFMQKNPRWHGKTPNEQEAYEAILELS